MKKIGGEGFKLLLNLKFLAAIFFNLATPTQSIGNRRKRNS